nr:uncharacterized protein LOC109159386 [Ipomoea trifida]
MNQSTLAIGAIVAYHEMDCVELAVFEFYIDILINGEIVILISIYHKETYVKTKARSIRNSQALVLKREHVYGGKLYATKANFSGKEKRISTDCWVLGSPESTRALFSPWTTKGCCKSSTSGGNSEATKRVEVEEAEHLRWRWKFPRREGQRVQIQVRKDADEEGVVDDLEKLVIIIVRDVKLSSVMEWESIEENELKDPS